MPRIPIAALPCLSLLALALPASAAPGGPIGTLPRGPYVCELPGDALGPRGDRKPEFDFTVIQGSSYRAGDAIGTYLLTGDRMTFTSGPFDGARFHRVAGGFLRRMEADGSDGDLRCVRQTANNRIEHGDDRPAGPVIIDESSAAGRD